MYIFMERFKNRWNAVGGFVLRLLFASSNWGFWTQTFRVLACHTAITFWAQLYIKNNTSSNSKCFAQIHVLHRGKIWICTL